MRYLLQLCLLLVFTWPANSAQLTPDAQLHRAFMLADQGQFSDAVQIAQRLIDSGALHGAELGRAWAMVGFVYREQGQFVEARHALDRSIELLQRDPSLADDYAATLDHLGALNQDEGQQDDAEHAWLKALKVLEASPDSIAKARLYRDLAELKLEERRISGAEKYLKEATSQINLDALPDKDRAAYSLTRGWLALEKGHLAAAVDAYRESLDLCRVAYGNEHFVTGWGFMVLGNALAQTGAMDEALSNMRTGLGIIQSALGTQSPRYWAAELAYSRILDLAGSHSEAAELKKSAEQNMKDMFRRECAGCTISISALR